MQIWLSVLILFDVYAGLIEAFDPCQRQPFYSTCHSWPDGGSRPYRSQVVIRYYRSGDECVAYPYGLCRNDVAAAKLFRYQNQCEKKCMKGVNTTIDVPTLPPPISFIAEVASIRVEPRFDISNVSNGSSNQTASSSDNVVKPGICPFPEVGEYAVCVRECHLDYECPRSLKCCYNGCGRLCLEAKAINGDPCDHAKDHGGCYGYFRRWWYDSGINSCKQFIYGGCGGTGNNFLTESDCMDTCWKPEKSTQIPWFRPSTSSSPTSHFTSLDPLQNVSDGPHVNNDSLPALIKVPLPDGSWFQISITDSTSTSTTTTLIPTSAVSISASTTLTPDPGASGSTATSLATRAVSPGSTVGTSTTTGFRNFPHPDDLEFPEKANTTTGSTEIFSTWASTASLENGSSQGTTSSSPTTSVTTESPETILSHDNETLNGTGVIFTEWNFLGNESAWKLKPFPVYGGGPGYSPVLGSFAPNSIYVSKEKSEGRKRPNFVLISNRTQPDLSGFEILNGTSDFNETEPGNGTSSEPSSTATPPLTRLPGRQGTGSIVSEIHYVVEPHTSPYLPSTPPPQHAVGTTFEAPRPSQTTSTPAPPLPPKNSSIYCPHNLKPLEISFGHYRTCLPSPFDNSRDLRCPTNYTCFFNGLNFYCCPSVEAVFPSAKKENEAEAPKDKTEDEKKENERTSEDVSFLQNISQLKDQKTESQHFIKSRDQSKRGNAVGRKRFA